MASDEEDAYVAQLKEVFNSCDQDGVGYLNRDELAKLCSKLQLHDQSDTLVQQLMLPGNRARVGFEEFKEGFVAALSESVNDMASTDGEEELPEDEKPIIDIPRQNGVNSTLDSHAYFHKQGVAREDQQAGAIISRAASPDCQTYESEGRTSRNVVLMSNDESEHLREVWRQLGVGQNGALSIEELAIVCEHIGMEQMSDQELKQLFDKLDVNRDGKVGLQEFLNGLFQHGSSTAPSPKQPISNHQQKPQTVRTDASSTDVLDIDAGLFSTLDPEGIGFAKPALIIELWESLGISHGGDILEYLQFSLSSIVNLSALSKALHHEIHHVEGDNAVYQAAIVSYENELRCLRAQIEHLNAENEKSRSDLHKASHRISVLVAEGDERHTSLELSKESALDLLEKKHEKKMKILQADLEREREAISRQALKQSSTLQVEIDQLKDAESHLKSRLAASKKDVEKLERELGEMSEQCLLFETQNKRQAMELLSAKELKEQLDEMESRTDRFLEEQQQMAEMETRSLKEENKELKDRIDELTAEISDLRQQLLTSRRQMRNTKHGSSDSLCSLMSDYVPTPIRGTPVDGLQSPSTQIKQKLSPSPEENEKILQEKISKLEQEKLTLEEEYRTRNADLRLQMQEAVDDKEKEMSQRFLTEKEDLREIAEKQKEKFLKEQKIRLEQEFEHRLQEEKLLLNRQLEATVSRDHSEELKREKTAMEELLQQQKQTLELEAKRERLRLMERFEEEKAALVDKHRLEVYDYENMLIKGVEGLRGRLKTDFFALLDRHKAEVTENERSRINEETRTRDGRQREAREEEFEKLQRKHETERRELIRNSDAEITRIRDRLSDERIKLERQHQSQITEIEQRFETERENFERQRDALVASHGREKTAWQRRLDLMKEELSEDISRSTQERLEEEFVDQIDRIKNAYDAERIELEKRLRLLQTEVTDERQMRKEVEGERSKGGQRVEELNMALSSLRKQNYQLEDLNRIQKQKIQQLQIQLQEPAAAAESEQTILRAIEQQKSLIVASMAHLKDHVLIVSQTLQHSLETQSQPPVDDSLLNELQETKEKLGVTEASLQLSESSRLREVQSLRDQLTQTADVADATLREQLRKAENKVKQLEIALEKRSTETNKLISASSDDLQRTMTKIDQEKTAYERQLKQTKKILDENVTRLKKQLEKSAKTDILVKDLYVENAQLIKALEMTERRQRAAENKVFSLQDKNNELNKVVRMICPAALG